MNSFTELYFMVTFVDIMHIFFELEETLDMDVMKKDGKTHLIFDDNNKNIATLISYLNLWLNQKIHYQRMIKTYLMKKSRNITYGNLAFLKM